MSIKGGDILLKTYPVDEEGFRDKMYKIQKRIAGLEDSIAGLTEEKVALEAQLEVEKETTLEDFIEANKPIIVEPVEPFIED